jgi:predicted peroxiredoxin
VRPLVVKLTCGAEAAERSNQALTVAATAAASGAAVSLWLTGEAVWFATSASCPDLALGGAASAADLVAAVLAAGKITVCTQCAARRSLDTSALLPGVRVAGAASFVEEALAPDVQALVY